MLVYLLFIFASGGCVCWLLFLNYQQHVSDERRARRRRLKAKSARFRPLEHQDVDDDDEDEEEDDAEQLDCNQSDFYEQRASCSRACDLESSAAAPAASSGPGAKVDSVINLYSEHALLLPSIDECEPAELEEIGSITCKCVDCQAEQLEAARKSPQAARQSGGQEEELLRGWPELAEPTSAQVEPATCESQLVGMWPLVALHENPLTSAPDQLEPAASEFGEPEALLARSQMLSLSGQQQRHRAAIRMISADSVQLLVQQQQLQQLKAEEAAAAAAAAKKSEEAEAPNVKLEVRRAEEAGALQRPAPKWQPRNDLLMVMQQHRPTQNNDTDSAGAAAESELSSDSFGQSPPRGQWTRSGQAGETAPAPRASSLATISRQEDRAEWQARVEQPAVRQRPLGQVERAISLHMLKQQQRAAASADAAGRLPTLAQLQAQMEAAKAQLRAAQTATQQRADSARADQQRASGHGNASGGDGDGDSDGAGQSPLATCDSNTTTQHLAPTAARSNFAAANAAADSTQTPKTTTTTENSQLEQNSSNRRGSPTATNSSIGPQNGAGELNEVIVLQKVEGRSSSSSSSGSKFHESEVERRVSEASASTPATCHEGRQMRVGRDFRSESMDSTPAPLPSASPTPQPRLTQNQQQQQLDPIRSELTINVTSPQVAQVPTQPATGRQLEQLEQRLANGGYNCGGQQLPASHRRVRDLAAELSASCASSCQSTPTNCSSLLSSADSTLTSASSAFIAQLNAANSSELIPRLIERLDRKLVVMKREQLALLREIEANELAGQRLLCAMRKRLTVQEFDKINMQANEIEKVTRLILSLKLRLKRIEAELKEREASTASAASAAAAAQQRAGSRGELNNTFDHSASSPESCSRLADESDRRQQSAIESESDEEVQLRIAQTSQHLLNALQQQQQQQSRGSNLGASSAGQTTGGSRGLSDPTSTSGLPKRNHQHHASLQSAASIKAAGCKTGGSADGEARQKHEHAASSGSSDSIFNSADSAIGGSCTLASDSSSSAHGGSSNNLNHQRPASHSQAGSAAGSSPSRHSHLSSSISVSSHSSMASSVPSSPSLMSPTSSNTQGAANSHQEQPALKSRRDSNNNSNSSANSTSLLPTSGAHKPTGELLDGASLMALNLVSELEILQAKRNKLLSQLEEAHQLEECIVKRNSNIVDRILSKYQPSSTDSQSEESNELLEFKQFTKLKSLLLKDSHDIADRIDSAELQLSELRHSAGEPI